LFYVCSLFLETKSNVLSRFFVLISHRLHEINKASHKIVGMLLLHTKCRLIASIG